MAGDRKFRTAAELRKAMDGYFAKCDEEGTLYSEGGLARHLNVALLTLRSWYDGTRVPEYQHDVEMAYLRIQEQIETDPRYQEKSMVSRSIFLNKQRWFGGYQDKIEAKQDISVNVKMGSGMDESDFK